MAQKTIIETLRARRAKFMTNPTGTRQEQIDLAELATAAVLGGIESDAWRDYMKEFAVNNKQLRRLRGRDGMFGETWGPRALAYMGSGGICSIDSVGGATDGYMMNDDDDLVKGLVGDGGDFAFNEVDPDFPANADA